MAARSNPHVLHTQDTDVFGDGALEVLALPGHTPGTLAVVVDDGTRPAIVTGDVVESAAALRDGVPGPHDSDPAASAASIERLKAVAAARGADLVISHVPATWPRV